MKILAFDTSTKFLSIALMDKEEVIKELHFEAGIKHSEILIPRIKDMLNEAGWNLSDIELICVGLGPGSFTGLRIAVATVKGLTISDGMKIKGVPTMDAMARRVEAGEKFVAPLLDAHKGKVYSCIYEKENGKITRTTDYLLLTVDELLDSLKEKVLFFGSGAEKYIEKIKENPLAEVLEGCDFYPRAADIGLIGLERLSEGADEAETIDPLYLHSKECNITSRDKK